MNGKFFDLKREKQDKIFNSGFSAFACNGYRHASTDEIVSTAGISKGLLFHYFSSKSLFYASLYNYGTSYALLDLHSQFREGKSMDFFELERQFLTVETRLLSRYPYLLLFLDSIHLETDPDALQAIQKEKEADPSTVGDFYQQLEDAADYSAYLRIDSKENFASMLRYVKTGVMREVLPHGEGAAEEYHKRVLSCIDSLQRLAAQL